VPNDPFTHMKFLVTLTRGLRAAFSEVSGLEVNLIYEEVKEGGRNKGPRRLEVRASSPPLVLKRGITDDIGFWQWAQENMRMQQINPSGGVIVLQSATGKATWEFERGRVTKVRCSDLSAMSTGIAIEELHIVHEGLRRK